MGQLVVGPAPDAMSCEQLARLLGTPRPPVILDVRLEAVRAVDPQLLAGARALSAADLQPDALATLSTTMASPVVVVCAEGRQLSQGAAAWPRHNGVGAEYLMGGQAA